MYTTAPGHQVKVVPPGHQVKAVPSSFICNFKLCPPHSTSEKNKQVDNEQTKTISVLNCELGQVRSVKLKVPPTKIRLFQQGFISGCVSGVSLPQTPPLMMIKIWTHNISNVTALTGTLKGQKWFHTSTALHHGSRQNWNKKTISLLQQKCSHFILGGVSLHFQNLLTLSWQRLVRRLDENLWQWIPGSSVSASKIENYTDTATVPSHSIFQHTTHFGLDLDLGYVAARKKSGMSFIHFHFSASVDLWIRALWSLKYPCSLPKYTAITGHMFTPTTSTYLFFTVHISCYKHQRTNIMVRNTPVMNWHEKQPDI